MLQSMTGFGKATLELPERKITIEIRSLNSKNLDLNTRISSVYKEKEIEIRSFLSEKLQRGKVDFLLFVEKVGSAHSQQIKPEVIQAYIQDFLVITPDAKPIELLPIVMKLPDVLTYSQEEIDEQEWQKIIDLLTEAVVKLNNYRKEEGQILFNEISLRINNILDLLTQIDPFEQLRIETIRERFRSKIEEQQIEMDNNRFEQEMIFYLEKLDVTEEKVRLKNNCNYFLNEMNSEVSNGRKLGFISQEIGREINTLGSKSNQSDMQKIVVQMKDELEKIKEQLLNIL